MSDIKKKGDELKEMKLAREQIAKTLKGDLQRREENLKAKHEENLHSGNRAAIDADVVQRVDREPMIGDAGITATNYAAIPGQLDSNSGIYRTPGSAQPQPFSQPYQSTQPYRPLPVDELGPPPPPPPAQPSPATYATTQAVRSAPPSPPLSSIPEQQEGRSHQYGVPGNEASAPEAPAQDRRRGLVDRFMARVADNTQPAARPPSPTLERLRRGRDNTAEVDMDISKTLPRPGRGGS